MKRVLCFFTCFLCFSDVSASWFTSGFVGKKAYVAPCKLTGSDTEIAGQCSTWCKSQHADWVDDSTKNYVTAVLCSGLDITLSSANSKYKYCCVNNSVITMVGNGSDACKCPGTNRRTVLGGDGYSVKRNYKSTDFYSFECLDYKCFCNAGYYGTVKKLSSSSSSDTCTKCPAMPGWGYNNAAISGTTYVPTKTNLTDDDAPASSTIKSCYISASCSMSPYCDRYDETGQFEITSNCYY